MKKSSFWLLVILILSFCLRVYHLGQTELFGDELDVGYHAYSLLKTGRDYSGNLLPTYAHSLSEWRAPLLMYASVPFVAVFGLNEWGVRLPSIFFGLLNIVLLYFLVEKLFKDKKLSLISVFILAVIPWHIHYSRVAFEVTLLLSLILGGTLLYLKKRYRLSFLLFGLSFYTYSTANIFVPLFLLILFLTFTKSLKKVFWPGVLLFLVLLPSFFNILKGYGGERFKLISIFNNPETIDRIVNKRNTGVSPSVERIFNNKVTGWGKEFISNYLTSFSPQFLFLNGDPLPRHNPTGFGQVYWFLLPFLLVGVYSLVGLKDKKVKLVIFSWLLLSPVASALTVGGGVQATRLFIMLPALVILISLGIRKFFDLGKIRFLILLGIFTSLSFWFFEYLVHYPKESYQWWHYGYKEAFSWLKDQDNLGKVFINNTREPALIRYLFWTKYQPRRFFDNFNGDQVGNEIFPGFDGFKLEDVYFGSINKKHKIEWLKENMDNHSVYLGFQNGDVIPGDWDWVNDPPDGLVVLKVVKDPWQKKLMYWVAKE